MKKIFIIFMIFIIFIFFAGCPITDPHVTPTATSTPTPVPLAPPVEMNKIKFALYDGSALKLWDGENLVPAYFGQIEPAGNRRIAIDDVLYYFDDYGNSEYALWLPTIPDAITTKPAPATKATVVYSDDIFVLEDIPPEEAYAAGSMYRHYTRIYENGVERGGSAPGNEGWRYNEWWCKSVITTASGHVLARDQNTAWHNLTDDKIVKTAYPDGIMLYNMGALHGYIADATGEYEVTWQYNYFDNARHLLADGVWYTGNGYTWTAATGVVTNANSMFAWNNYATYPASYDAPYGERPYILPAGVYEIAGEEVTFWIECVTGKLYRHTPSTNVLQFMTNLYAGPYTRGGAAPYFNGLTPVIVDNYMYYHADGEIWAYNFDINLVTPFAGDEELIPW